MGDEKTTVSIVVTKRMKRQLRDLARKSERTISQQGRIALREHLRKKMRVQADAAG